MTRLTTSPTDAAEVPHEDAAFLAAKTLEIMTQVLSAHGLGTPQEFARGLFERIEALGYEPDDLDYFHLGQAFQRAWLELPVYADGLISPHAH